MTDDERIAYFENLEEEAKTDKVAWMEFEIERLKNSLNVESGRTSVRFMEVQDKISAMDDKYSRRADCQSKRIISLENQIDNVMWISFIAIAVSIVSIVARIIGG